MFRLLMRRAGPPAAQHVPSGRAVAHGHLHDHDAVRRDFRNFQRGGGCGGATRRGGGGGATTTTTETSRRDADIDQTWPAGRSTSTHNQACRCVSSMQPGLDYITNSIITPTAVNAYAIFAQLL